MLNERELRAKERNLTLTGSTLPLQTLNYVLKTKLLATEDQLNIIRD